MKRFCVYALLAMFVMLSSVSFASDTPADAVFNGVKWYTCKSDMVKYKQGMEEKESKWECVNSGGAYEIPTQVVASGNDKIDVKIEQGIRGSIYYYPVMTTAQADHFKDKNYKLQCDQKLGTLDGGISENGVALYMFSPPEMDQYNGNQWADDHFKAKGQKVLPYASIYGNACRRDMNCAASSVNCQFYSTETGKRFGLFSANIPGKMSNPAAAATGDAPKEGAKKKLKNAFGF